MNASRLKEIIDLMLRRESDTGLQDLLNASVTALANLASGPQEQSYQTAFAAAATKLKAAVSTLSSSFKPAEIKMLEEIGAAPYFLDDIAGRLDVWVLQNPISPAVARTQLETFVNERATYLATVRQTANGLEQLHIHPSKPPVGSAELDVLIPRDLFQNQLDQLLKELAVVNRVLRAFSEAATGSAQPVEVHEISTSDPLFSLVIDPITTAMIAGVVTWALNTWKQVEDIRKIRAETRKLSSFSEKEVKDIFDAKVAQTIEEAIAKKVDELVPDTGKAGREKEQRNDLTWALQSVLARIERGMTVEVRFIPPPPPPADATQEQQKVAAAFQTIAEAVPQLAFPPAEPHPIMELPPPEPVKPPKPKA